MSHRRSTFRFIVIQVIILALAALDNPIAISADVENSMSTEDSPKLLAIRSKGKYGLIDRAGNLIVSPRFDSPFMGFDSRRRLPAGDNLKIPEGESLRPGQINRRWGYFDKDGKEVIPAQYSGAGIFHDGWAQVQVGDKWGIIDRTGKSVVDPQYSFIGPFSEGIARVAIGGIPLEGGFPGSKWGFINKKGEQFVPIKYDYVQSFSNGRALVNVGGRWKGESGLSFQGGLWGVIDKKGNFVVEPKIEMKSGLSLDEKPQTDTADLLPVKCDGKFGYRDRIWNLAIKPQFDEARPFSEQLAAVKLGGNLVISTKRDNL
jgi:hypothetical protein